MLESSKHRRLITVRAGVVFLVGGLALSGCGGSSRPASKPAQVPHIFSADVRSGPDSGLSVWGGLKVSIARSGQVTGALIPGGRGQAVPVSGLVAGRSLKLVFHLPGGRLMTGTGTAQRDILRYKMVPTEGTLSGPRPGDHGDWLVITADQRYLQQLYLQYVLGGGSFPRTIGGGAVCDSNGVCVGGP